MILTTQIIASTRKLYL